MGEEKKTVLYHVLLTRQQLLPQCIAAATAAIEHSRGTLGFFYFLFFFHLLLFRGRIHSFILFIKRNYAKKVSKSI